MCVEAMHADRGAHFRAQSGLSADVRKSIGYATRQAFLDELVHGGNFFLLYPLTLYEFFNLSTGVFTILSGSLRFGPFAQIVG